MKFAPISLTIFLSLVGCPPSVSSEPAVIDVRADHQVDRELIDKAIGYFRGVCGGLQSAGVDLQQGVATLTDC